MLNFKENTNPPVTWEEPIYGPTEEDVIKAKLQEAVRRLDSYGGASIPLHVLLASIVREGKEKLPRRFGQFLHHMQKSRSWGALYLHLYDVRDLLEPARAWAAETSHRLASAYSVESLLKLVSDFEQRDNPIPPKQPQNAKKVVSNGATVANLSKIDANTDEFVAVVVEQANGDLAETARIFQSTVHDLIAQIRSEL